MAHMTDDINEPLHVTFARLSDEELERTWAQRMTLWLARWLDYETVEHFGRALKVIVDRLKPTVPPCRVETPGGADAGAEAQGTGDERQARRRAKWAASAKRARARRDARRAAIVAGPGAC